MKKSIVLLILASLVFLSIGAYSQSRYAVVVSPQIYTSIPDPNDKIYGMLLVPPREWIDTYGNNERTVLFYNISYNRATLKALVEKIMLKDKSTEPNEPAIAEPNEPSRVK